MSEDVRRILYAGRQDDLADINADIEEVVVSEVNIHNVCRKTDHEQALDFGLEGLSQTSKCAPLLSHLSNDSVSGSRSLSLEDPHTFMLQSFLGTCCA